MIKISFKLPQNLPKFSGFTSTLSTPEKQLETMLKETLGIELPPGPSAMVMKFQRSLETGSTPEFPEFPGMPGLPSELPQPPSPQGILAKLPKIPGLPELPGTETKSPGVTEKKEYNIKEPRSPELRKNSTPPYARTPRRTSVRLTK